MAMKLFRCGTRFYNRALVPYLKDLIGRCFDVRKPDASYLLPSARLTVTCYRGPDAGTTNAELPEPLAQSDTNPVWRNATFWVMRRYWGSPNL